MNERIVASFTYIGIKKEVRKSHDYNFGTYPQFFYLAQRAHPLFTKAKKKKKKVGNSLRVVRILPPRVG